MSPNHSSRWPQIYLGISMTTFATLLLELSLTRIFSVVFLYHFAFLAISIAMFGLGAGGVFSYFFARRGGSPFASLGVVAAINSVASIGSLAFVLSRQGEVTGITLSLVYLASAVPFCLAGIVVSLAIAESIDRIDRAYFFDLVGAAAGCLALVPLLNTIGGPNTVIVAAIVYGASSLIWFRLGGFKAWPAAIVLPALLVFLLGTNQKNGWVDVRYSKGRSVQGESFVQWNSFSRVGLSDDPASGKKNIVIDGDANTLIAPFDFDHLQDVDRHRLLSDGPGFAYTLRPGAKTLIIGPGGGMDVARALASGSRDVTGVEINPIIATTIMRERFPEFSHNLYFRPEVHIAVEDGRSFVRRADGKYQILQATLVDTWASTAAGAFALSENNLYTTEAFREYLTHLTDDGMLTFTRWGVEPPRESLRLVSLAMEALKSLGEESPRSNVIVVRQGEASAGSTPMDTVLVSRKPFTPADVARARALADQAGLHAIYLPEGNLPSPFQDLLTSVDPRRYQADYLFNITPVHDDSPFFFYSVQPRDVLDFGIKAPRNTMDYRINLGLPVLVKSLVLSLLATGWTLALPPLRLGSRLPKEKGSLKTLSYFVFLGVGYILIQVAFIQKFILFLGHPTYALTVIIFSMLVSSGVGSYRSKRIAGDERRLARVLTTIGALVAILAFFSAPLTTAGVGWPFWIKVIVTVVLIAPAGYFMGMPFPAGLAQLERKQPAYVRWAWSLNAAASVMGSALALFLAIYVGLRVTLLIGGALYLAALWASRTKQPAAEHFEAAEVGTPVAQAF